MITRVVYLMTSSFLAARGSRLLVRRWCNTLQNTAVAKLAKQRRDECYPITRSSFTLQSTHKVNICIIKTIALYNEINNFNIGFQVVQ